MKKKDASFWSDIKALDERLAREPDSFCFARLSEIYLKVGLVADALHTARTGVAKHPGYLAGQRALAMACNASGLHDECRAILERITAATPEDVEALKILASLYVAAGDRASAIRTYGTVLDFRPDDVGSATELEALRHGGAMSSTVSSAAAQATVGLDEDEIIELSESDIHEEPSDEELGVLTSGAGGGTLDHHDPLSTLTLAELYEQQGFLSKALEIYHTILADDPKNPRLLAKVAQLEEREQGQEAIPEQSVAVASEEEPDFTEPEALVMEPPPLESQLFGAAPEAIAAVAEPVLSASGVYEPVSTPFEYQNSEPISGSISSIEPEFSSFEVHEDASSLLETNAFAPLAHKAADNVVETLDVWLENIRRIKACR